MPINWPDLLVFMTAALLLNLTPGNDMMFVLGQALKSGAKAGIAASLGIAAGSLVHLALVALGVAVILSRHPALFEAIRWAGAAYLVFLAIKALRAPGSVLERKPRSLMCSPPGATGFSSISSTRRSSCFSSPSCRPSSGPKTARRFCSS